jgi:hypothetical protein
MAANGAQQPPSLYINNGDGTFTDAFATAFPPGNPLTHVNDAEGSAWADLFNTGTPDLLQVCGGTGTIHFSGSFFFVNRQGQLSQEAAADGLGNDLTDGREPLFLDWNHDGLLDTLFLNSSLNQKPTVGLYQQTPTGFVNVTAQAGLTTAVTDPAWAQSVDLTGDGVPDLVIGPSADSGKAPVFFRGNVGTPGYTPVPGFLPNTHDVTDMAVGDYFNTGYNDIFFTRRLTNQSDVEQSGSNVIAAHLLGGPQTGFTFQSTGALTFDLGMAHYSSNNALTDQIFIGSQGYHPSALPFTLDPTDPNNQGILTHDPSNGQGLYLGYDPSTQTWEVQYANKVGMSPFILDLSQPATNLTPVGFDPNAEALQPVFLVYNPATGKFQDRTVQAGLAAPLAAGSVVAGDFNNDGLLDLYVSTEHELADQGGVLYLNNGDGTFRAVPGNPAQPGVFFSDVENHVGRRVALADYNGDGTLDLFLPATMFQTPGKDYEAAPNELLYNAPNGNNWVEFNLQGVESNRDAIGAVVYLTAGGVTQRRDVTGGKHLGAQNGNTVHFGLGQNTTIDQVVIDWPSGIVQTLTNVPVDRLQTITEPGGHSTNQARPISTFSPNQTYPGVLNTGNTQDFYKFAAAGPVIIQLTLTGQVQARLLDQSGNVLARSQSHNGQQVLTINEPAGNYFVEVSIDNGVPSTSYALTFDVVPAVPLVTGLVATPAAAAAAPVTLTATASTATTGNAVVGGAEFFIDKVGGNGTGVAMAAQDGTFDQSTEGITGTVGAALFNGLSVGSHQAFVHARDAQGTWGPFVAVTFRKDNQGPITSQLSVTPPQTSTPPTVAARVSDKTTGVSRIQAAEYFIDTPGAPGTGTPLKLGKQSDAGVIRLVSAVIPTDVFDQLAVGQHTVYVRGEDVLGNWGPLISVSFSKQAAG